MSRLSLPEERPDGLDAPLTKKLMKLGSRAHVRLFKLTNGRIGATWRVGAGFDKPVPTLLLEHIGRTSGKTYTTPVVYLTDGPNIVVVASQGGLAKNPQWYFNLKAHPDTRIHLPRERARTVRARVAEGAEREALWTRLLDLYADFAKYATWTDREIPVVILEPR